MKKAELLDRIRSERAKFDALVARVPHERMSQPGAAGNWSVKDIRAHVTWHEEQMVGMVKARAFEGSDWWNLETDARNALIYQTYQDWPLANVMVREARIYKLLLDTLETLSDDDLADHTRFRDMPPEWTPWQIIASNTFEHYEQHLPDLESWLAASPTTR